MATLAFWTAAIAGLTLLVVILDFLLSHAKTPRSKIRIEQLSDDRGTIDSSSKPNWVTLVWNMTAVNDGKRDAHLADPVFIDATFSKPGEEKLITPDDIGRGSVTIEFTEKPEEKVEGLSNDRIQIKHRLSKQMGIHDLISEYDTMEFRYSVLVEDGVTPNQIEAESTLDISGVTIRWNKSN